MDHFIFHICKQKYYKVITYYKDALGYYSVYVYAYGFVHVYVHMGLLTRGAQRLKWCLLPPLSYLEFHCYGKIGRPNTM